MVAALEGGSDCVDRATSLRARLEASIVAAGGEVVAPGSPRIHTIGAYRMPGVPSNAQLIQFDMAGIAVSAGSACSSGSLRSEEHTSELQSLMRISYAVFCLKKKKQQTKAHNSKAEKSHNSN